MNSISFTKLYFKVQSIAMVLWGGWLLFFFYIWIMSDSEITGLDNDVFSTYQLVLPFVIYAFICLFVGGRMLLCYNKKNATQLGHLFLITIFLLLLPDFIQQDSIGVVGEVVVFCVVVYSIYKLNSLLIKKEHWEIINNRLD